MIELSRSFVVDDVIGRTLEGTAVTYHRTYRVSDDGGRTFYREGWQPGSFTQSITASRNTFEMRHRHGDQRLGIVSFEDDETQLAFRATLDDTEEANQALVDYEAGLMRGVSLQFRPRKQDRGADGVLWRNRADIRELSLTNVGQYDDAKVSALRASSTLQEINQLLLEGDRLLAYCRTV